MIKFLSNPLRDIVFTSYFGSRNLTVSGVKYWWHNGVDFKATVGTEVLSVAKGVIKVAKDNPSGYGKYIVIDHGNFQTLYAHLSRFNVCVGDTVAAGQVIALSGNTGASTGPHLHFEVRIGNYSQFWDRCLTDSNVFMRCVDPLPFIEACREASTLTIDSAKQIISEKIGFDTNTMNYLSYYRFGNELITKIAKIAL